MIHRLRIQNFKSIADVSVDLSPVTVLVGKSGTGKSNFVRAVRLLRDLLSTQLQQPVLKQALVQSRPALMPNSAVSFEVDFSIVGIKEKLTYELALNHEAPVALPLTERLCLGDKCLYDQTSAGTRNGAQARWVVEPEILPLPNPGPIALGRIPSISEVVIAFTALTTGIGCYAFSDRVLSGGPQRHSPTSGLEDDATNFLFALRDIVNNLEDLTIRRNMVAALQRVNPSISSVELNDIRHPNHVLVGHKINGKTLPLPLSHESDGFRRFYAHLLALYQRPPKQTLLFEHPEDGIHPGALSMLADEFKSAPESGRGQIILTTHSPKLLDHFDADQIRVVEIDGLATRIGPVSEEQTEAIRERLLDAGELLTVDPARLRQEATAT